MKTQLSQICIWQCWHNICQLFWLIKTYNQVLGTNCKLGKMFKKDGHIKFGLSLTIVINHWLNKFSFDYTCTLSHLLQVDVWNLSYYLGVLRSRNFALTSKVRSAAFVPGNFILIFNKKRTTFILNKRPMGHITHLRKTVQINKHMIIS